MTSAQALLERDLLFVSGKGGAGKTAVAAALAMAAASRGRRPLVCELAGASQLAAAGVPTITVSPDDALREWMRSQPGGAIAAAVLGRSAGFMRFVDAAPGAKEMVSIGKAVDLARSANDVDLVIVDGPSTGHALAMLAAPRTIATVARLGPVGAQARAVRDFLGDARHTGYVGVALPEEMPLHELLELEAGLHDAIGRGLDLVVVDGIYPDRFSDEEAERLQALTEHGSVAAALSEHRLARLHAARVRGLRRRVKVPVITLPFVFAVELGATEYELLGRQLLERPQARRGRSATEIGANPDADPARLPA